MLVASKLLERVIRDTPLGVRFRDPLDGRLVGEELEVSAHPVVPDEPPAPWRPEDRRSSRRLEAVPNGAGVWVFPEPAATRWPSWQVEVRDRCGRFLPCTFTARCGETGLLAPEVPGSSSSLPEVVQLFSAPGRAPEPPVAVVRMELWDPGRAGPGSWALIEATVGDGPAVRGLASAEGQLAIFLRHPDLRAVAAAGSGSELRRGRLDEVRWDVQLRAFYGGGASARAVPDLAEVLAQPQASLWESHPGGRPLGIQTLTYGTELVVRSADTAAPSRAVRVTTS